MTREDQDPRPADQNFLGHGERPMAREDQDYDEIRLKDVQILKDDSYAEGIIIKGRGDNRFVTYEELVELAESDHPVTIQ